MIQSVLDGLGCFKHPGELISDSVNCNSIDRLGYSKLPDESIKI